MHHYIDDDYYERIPEFELAKKLGIDICQWHDKQGILHFFSPENEKRLESQNNDTRTNTK